MVVDVLVKRVRDEPRSRQDQWNNNNLVQLPLLLVFKHQIMIFSLFSGIVACRLCVNGIAMSMKVDSFFVLMPGRSN